MRTIASALSEAGPLVSKQGSELDPDDIVAVDRARISLGVCVSQHAQLSDGEYRAAGIYTAEDHFQVATRLADEHMPPLSVDRLRVAEAVANHDAAFDRQDNAVNVAKMAFDSAMQQLQAEDAQGGEDAVAVLNSLRDSIEVWLSEIATQELAEAAD